MIFRLKKFLVALTLTLLASIAILLFVNWRFEPDKDELYYEAFRSQYAIFSPPVPARLKFAYEHVPLDLWDVRERFDRELLVNTYWQSNTVLYLKRANRWFPVIEPILKANGIPEDFKYLALIESGFLNVISPAGAAGFWQILEPTGRELGLEINEHVDERFHPVKATEAAIRFLQNAKERFGSWTLAAASYNIGMARLGRILETQMQSCYYQLHLNEETSRYVFRILAVKTIFEDPRNSGFHLRPNDLYPPLHYKTVAVDTAITNLAGFAIQFGTNYKTLRLLNPWLRSNELPQNQGKTYHINLPLI
ncbi:MAG TPA: lytic transglycosylase domain-containing protein [Bacteroidales bacterium]|nr:lytic transglycosylase domain-containing protein [Bacteroidales bacterium]